MIGFLIINYNDVPTTKKLIQNIKDYDCIDKIVVVDNHSTDNSYEELKKIKNKKLVVLHRIDGSEYGAGINFGLNYLKKEGIYYTFVSNSDVVISSEEVLKKMIKRKKDAFMIGPVIKEHNGYNKGWKVPTNFQLVLSSIPYFYQKFISFYHYKEDFYKGDFLPVEAISFCFFFVSILDLEKVGFLDEFVHLYFEENIMSVKLNKKGIYLCLDAEVFHNHSVTIDKNLNRKKKYLALSKSRRYFAKNYNHAGIFTRFFLWFFEKLSCLFLSIFYS